jgi:hypothetical protein
MKKIEAELEKGKFSKSAIEPKKDFVQGYIRELVTNWGILFRSILLIM